MLRYFILLFFFNLSTQAQVIVNEYFYGALTEFSEGKLDKFKQTETIFILSNVFEKESYEKILQEAWNISPYRILDYKDFKIKDYLEGEFSFAMISSHTDQRSGEGGMVTYHYIEIMMLDDELTKEEYQILKSKEWSEARIRNYYSRSLAFIILFKKPVFPTDSNSNMSTLEEAENIFYSQDVFFNYELGFLKNNFQQINQLLSDEQVLRASKKIKSAELKQLKKQSLYIPSYHSIEYKDRGHTIVENNDRINSPFKAYDYKYKIISDEQLNEFILEGKELFYLRTTLLNTEMILEIVNSKTGAVIYRSKRQAYGRKLKSKDAQKLNKAINEF